VDRRDGNDMLATGALMIVASAVRAGAGCLELWSERVPELVRITAEMDEHDDESGEERAAMQLRVRDELMAVARNSAEIVMRELRRGVEDLDTYTREEESGAGGPPRPYRAKQ
jgi:hypothetical protein